MHEVHGAFQRVHQEEAPLQSLRLRESPDQPPRTRTCTCTRSVRGVSAPLSPQVVCWRCSDNKVALEYDGNRLNKVCKSCYSILSAQRGGRTEGGGRTPEVSFTHVQPNATEVFNRLAGMFLGFFSLPISQAEAPSQLMRSFLFYGDNPKTWKQVWCVLRTEPPTLQLYAAPQVGPDPGRRAPRPRLQGGNGSVLSARTWSPCPASPCWAARWTPPARSSRACSTSA